MFKVKFCNLNALKSQRKLHQTFHLDERQSRHHLIHKTDTMGVFYGLRSTEPENSRPRCAATSGHKFLTSRGFLVQICTNLRNYFTKLVPPLDPSAPDLQHPKISGPNVKPHAFGDIGVHSLSFTRHLTQPRAYMCHTCPPVL